MDKKLPAIIDYCRRIRRINNPYRYASSIRYKTIYTKARRKYNIYAKTSIDINDFQSFCDNPHLGLYYGSPINGTMIDKCLYEQEEDETRL